MKYYHCSPMGGLKVLQPGKPVNFEKPAGVYLTTLLPMAAYYRQHYPESWAMVEGEWGLLR